MASTPLIPKNGAVALASLTADFASFDISAGQTIDNTSHYGTNVMQSMTGSGTPGFAVNAGAFALAHATGTPLLLCGTSTIFSALGATCTLTLDTGVNYAGTLITGGIRLGHARMRGFVPLAISGASTGDWVETWATS